MSQWNEAIEAACNALWKERLAQSEANNAGWVDCVPTIGLEIEKALHEAENLVRALKRPEALDGWKLVPVEPTEAMLDAALDFSGERVSAYTAPRESGVALDTDISEEDAAYFNSTAKTIYGKLYSAMLGAAHTPPEEMK